MTWSNRVRTPFYLKEMVLDERIQIPHYAVGWEESCSAKLGVQCSLWRNHTKIERASKKERGLTALVYILLVSRQVPVSQQYWRKRIGPSLALLIVRESNLFSCRAFHSLAWVGLNLCFVWRIIRSSLSCYYPQGAQQPRCILSYRKRGEA